MPLPISIGCWLLLVACNFSYFLTPYSLLIFCGLSAHPIFLSLLSLFIFVLCFVLLQSTSETIFLRTPPMDESFGPNAVVPRQLRVTTFFHGINVDTASSPEALMGACRKFLETCTT